MKKERKVREEYCHLCRYWQPDIVDFRVGSCRRHAPIRGPMGGAWPITKRMDWCGEFRERYGEFREEEPK